MNIHCGEKKPKTITHNILNCGNQNQLRELSLCPSGILFKSTNILGPKVWLPCDSGSYFCHQNGVSSNCPVAIKFSLSKWRVHVGSNFCHQIFFVIFLLFIFLARWISFDCIPNAVSIGCIVNPVYNECIYSVQLIEHASRGVRAFSLHLFMTTTSMSPTLPSISPMWIERMYETCMALV